MFRLVKREKPTLEAEKYTEVYVVQENKNEEWIDLIETQDFVDAVILLTNIRKLGGIKRDTVIDV
ncbi:hypothetical protein EBU95_15650 [bacterium]|nr:hypothetical protein [bacterium]